MFKIESDSRNGSAFHQVNPSTNVSARITQSRVTRVTVGLYEPNPNIPEIADVLTSMRSDEKLHISIQGAATHRKIVSDEK